SHAELAVLLERLSEIEENPATQTALRLELAELRAGKLGDVDSAIELLRGLVEEQPNHVGAVLELTRLYETQARFEDLAELLTERIEAYANQSMTEEQTQCELRLAALYEEQLGEPEKAMSVLEEVLARDPSRREALLSMSHLQDNHGQRELAAETLARL